MLLSSWLGELCRGRVRVHSSTARRSNRLARSLVPAAMALESRVLLSNYTVTNTNDSGSGSLRYEVGLANSDHGADTITFDSTVFATPQTIKLTSGQIELNDAGGVTIAGPSSGVTIDAQHNSRVFQIDSGSIGNLTGLTITGGSNVLFGGGLEVAGNSSLTNCTVSGNAAKDSGGGIDVIGQLTLSNSTISSNSAARSGGGIDTRSNSVSNITNSTISGNTAFYGAGVYSSGTLALASSTVSGNSSSKNGGGVYINEGQATLTNLTISGNASRRDGGGLYFLAGKATLTNVTISGNSASSTGGGIYATVQVGGGTVAINNTIVAGNSVTAGGTSNITGTLTLTGSNNLIGTGGSGGLMNGSNGNIVGVDNPQLGPLANNGGATQTMALLPGSPAIQAGLVGTGIPATDQRGVPRIGGVDIGAYQAAFAGPLVVNSTDGGSNVVPNKLTLFEAVELANFRTSADTITFDPTVFATPQTITLTAGQLELTDSAATTITAPTAGLTISGNHASRVFKVDSGSIGNLTDLTITGGSNVGYGGGLYVAGTASLTNCTVSGNTADYAGGGIEVKGQLTLTNSTISNNASGNGGGIHVNFYNVCNIINSTISGNTSQHGGGGVYSFGTLVLANSTVSGNYSSGKGGGVYIEYGQATLTNSTISGNSSGNVGGGLNLFDGKATLTNVTISGNSASNDGGGIYAALVANARVVAINNTIVAGNTVTAGGTSDIKGLLTVSGSNNLIGTGGSGGLVNGTNGNQVGVDNPLLSSLGNYGGPTQTMALLPGSPAINAGSNTLAVDSMGNPSTSDQRGIAYVGTVDIGAFEYQGTSLIVNTTADGTTSAPGAITLREAVNEANAMGDASNSITFDPTVFANPKTITLTGGELPLRNGFGTTMTAPTSGLTISGNNTSRVFEVFKNAHASLNGLTITGGNPGSKSNGGGIYDYHGTVSLTNCTVTGNTAQFGGGIGAYGYNSAVTLTNSTVTNNTAFGGGGAYASYDGSLTLVNSTVSANTSTNGGGIAAYHGGSLTVTNCTVSGNSGSRYGAGITLVNNSRGTLTNVTVSGNTATMGGGSGLYVLNGSSVTVNNTIVAGNTNGDIFVNQASSVSGSNNLIGTGGSGGLMNGTNGNLVGVTNPLLAPLGSYGGPTQTIALLPGSPAVDAGNTSLTIGTTDQRGEPYVGTVDIGAFESQGFTLTPVPGSTPQSAITGSSFANPLSVTVTAKNFVEPVNGGLINFIVPLSGPSATLTSRSSTIAGGQASVSATANTIVGGFNATASTTEGTTATFVLNNIMPLALTGLGGTVNYLQGGSPIQVAPALVVTQNLGLNITSATVLFSNLQLGDRINFSNPFGLQHSFVQSPDGTSATLTFTGASSAASYQATLRSILFSCVATIPVTSPRSAVFNLSDTLTNTATGSQTIGVTLVNQAPVLSGIESTPLTYIANYPTYPPQTITNTLSVFDADSNNLTSAKVQITSGYQNNSNSHDLLLFTPQFGLTSSFNSLSGTLTLSGSTSVTNYRIALRSVTFSSSGPSANGTTRIISFTAYDDSTPTPLASNTVTRNVNMQLTVAPPTLSGLNGTTTFVKGGSPVPIASTIGVNQPLGLDLGGATVTFTNLQPGDRFDFDNQFALQRSLVYNPDGTSATLTLSGYATPAQYQTTLQSIIFWNVAGNLFTAPRTATFVVTDATGQPSASGVQNFTVAPANQPPLLSGIEQTPLVYQSNHPEFAPQQVTNTLLVTDPDSANLTGATVQITSGYNNVFGGNDILSFVNQSGISGSFNAATGTLTLSGLSSVSNYRVALRSVTFSTFGPNSVSGTRVVTFTTYDDTTPTPLVSNQVSRNVIVTTTNLSPVLSGLSPVSLYIQGSPPLLFASSLQVADLDSPVLSGTVISFTNWQAGDRLDFYNQFALQHTFTEDLVAHTASLTITGPTSVANYQTMLQSIGYYSVARLPSLTTRNFSVFVNDGHSSSNVVTGNINFQAK